MDDRDAGGADASHAGQLVVKQRRPAPEGWKPAGAAPALLLALLAACDAGQVAEPEAPLEIVPDSVTLTHVGERFAFAVRGGGGAGAGEVRWSSRDATVFTVDAAGTVTARGSGVSHVVASNLKSAAQALVQVRQVAAALDAFGDGQRGAPALSLLEPVGVRVLDAGGAPVSNALVRFEPEAGSGRADPEAAVSDSAGMASAVWTLGTAPGLQTLAVSTEGGASVEITATALDPNEAVASVGVHSGENQWALGGLPLPEAVVVRVVDAAERPVWGASVRFEPEVGSGRADPDAAETDSLGLASTSWTLEEQPGVQRLVAMAGGAVSAAFQATAVSDEGACNRTPAVASAIARVTGAGHCAQVTEEALGRIRGIGLGRKGIRRLRNGDFAGLAGLEALDLYENRLSALPPGIFAGLSRLEQLRLNSNELTQLPPDIFKGLSGLEVLYLHKNRLSALPPGIFAGLSRLRQLLLQSNELTQLPPDIFKGLSGLEQLGLYQNRLTELAPGTFADLDALLNIRIDYNELTDLPEDLFDGLSRLVVLTMRGNQLTWMPEGIFFGLSRLEDLVVAENRLTELPPGLFSETPALRRVALDGNRLTELPPGLFSETPGLQRLYLQQNRLAALPPGLFDGLPKLVRLDASFNRLAALPPGLFDGTPKLAELSLEFNALTELPRGVFAGLSELEWVTLERNPGAPFSVRPEFVRVDVGDPVAPGPARVVVRVPLGAPFALAFPLSVQRGTISREFVSVLPGDTVSTPFEVSATSAGEAAHVGFGPPPEVTAEGYGGLELARGEELVLFAEADNRSPVARSPVPAHRLQAGGPSAELVLGDYFGDPDGDSLAYGVVTTAAGVVDARVEEGVLWLDPQSVDTTEVEVTATDPGGLRATQRFRTWVVPAPDPDGFNIELYFEPGFTAEEEAAIRRAADRWMEAVTGDLPDVPVRGLLEGYCFDGPSRLRVAGVIDDVLIRMKLAARLGRAAAVAATCGAREESGHAFLGGSSFALWYVRSRVIDELYVTALHEIGHVLGIGAWTSSPSPPAWRDLFRGRDMDPLFAGPLAVAAFDAAGGEGYAGGKVPLEDRIPTLYVHWRGRVIPGDIMSVGSDANLLTAITLQALADLGHEVDLSKADPYTLPEQMQGEARGGATEAEGGDAEVLTNDVIEVPVVVVDRDGKVVRVIRR